MLSPLLLILDPIGQAVTGCKKAGQKVTGKCTSPHGHGELLRNSFTSPNVISGQRFEAQEGEPAVCTVSHVPTSAISIFEAI